MAGHRFNNSNSSSSRHIREDLRTRIQLGEWALGMRLPSIRQLAGEYNASTATIQIVMRTLCEAGDIEAHGTTRNRYHIPGCASAPDSSAIKENVPSRSAHILTTLREELLSGDVLDENKKVFQTKLLAKRYGTTAQTLLSIQRRLADEGLIRRYGRRWILNDNPHPESDMYFNLVLRPGQFAPPTKPFDSIFGSLEFELHRAGLRNGRPVVAYSPDPCSLQPLLRSSAAFFHCHSADLDSWMNFYTGIGNIPVIYVNIAPSEIKRTLPAHHILVHTDERVAGRAVGHYLARIGHSRIAFFFPENLESEPWLRERIEGLGQFYDPSEGAPDTRHLLLHSLRQRETDPDSGIETSTLRRLGRIMNAFYPGEVRSHFLRPLWETRNTIPVAKDLLERLTSVYKDRSITAWVFANDRLAFTGVRFLADVSERKTRPLLVGFDNSPASAQLGLSSYDFGIPQLCRLAVQSFLRPVDMRRTYGRRIALKGTLMIRESGLSR